MDIIYEWYKIFNLKDFDDLNVCDYSITVNLQNRGEETFRILKGLLYNVIVDNEFLTPNLNGKNGFNRNGRSALIDKDNNLWIGYETKN